MKGRQKMSFSVHLQEKRLGFQSFLSFLHWYQGISVVNCIKYNVICVFKSIRNLTLNKVRYISVAAWQGCNALFV